MSMTERLATIIRELDEAVDMLDMAAVAESIDQLRQIHDEMLVSDELSA
jgi:tetrahydromethanopterin S-methyltransferase subunit B